jgi:hypothetical protein
MTLSHYLSRKGTPLKSNRRSYQRSMNRIGMFVRSATVRLTNNRTVLLSYFVGFYDTEVQASQEPRPKKSGRATQ